MSKHIKTLQKMLIPLTVVVLGVGIYRAAFPKVNDDPLAHMLEVFDATCMAYAETDPKPLTAPNGFSTYDHYEYGEEDEEGKVFYRNRSSGLFVALSGHRCDVLYRNRLDLPPIRDLSNFLTQVETRAKQLSPNLMYEKDLIPNWPLYDAYLAGRPNTHDRWGVLVFKLPEPEGFLQLSLVYEP